MSTYQMVPSSYRKLFEEIIGLYDHARRSLVEAHWEIGKRIVQIEQDGGIRAAYGEGILQKLSEDLTRERGTGFSDSNLRRMRQFYLENQKCAPAHKLEWSHHTELLAVRDIRERRALERRAFDEKLTRDELRDLIRSRPGKCREAQKPEGGGADQPLLVPLRGIPGTYQVRGAASIGWPDKKILLFDHGFKCYSVLSPAASRGLADGDVVMVTETGGVRKSERTVKDLFTFRAHFERGMDGDTFRVVLDIGRGMISRQKLRLRGIDSSEIDTPAGQAAKKFTEDHLKNAVSLIVRSSKNDKYDRYEADVFLQTGTGEEVFLNNLLLEKGHAVRMEM